MRTSEDRVADVALLRTSHNLMDLFFSFDELQNFFRGFHAVVLRFLEDGNSAYIRIRKQDPALAPCQTLALG